jgi:TonB family protein
MGGAGAGAGALLARREAPREQAPPGAREDLLPEQRRGLDDVATLDGASTEEGTAPYTPGGTTDNGGAIGSAGSEARGLLNGFSTEQWQQLYTAIERAKNYPRFARERGIEGTVLVRFRVLPNGEIEKVDIIKSSGSDILDTASVSTVYRAAPMPYVNGWVEVPMSYVLK